MSETIAGYQLERRIHESERSLVYRTRSRPDAPRVVLKILKRQYPSPEEMVRYRREYGIIRSVQGKHLIRAEGLEHYKDTCVLLLEDFGGEPLSHWLSRGPLDLGQFLRLAIHLAQGLEELHAANVIHKDLNPSNILWNPETDELKLIGFGIATRLPQEPQTFRNPALLEGTLAYLSPEQTGRMNRDIDYRTDFYSLGVTFYEMLVGRRPFMTEDPLALLHCHLARTPPDLAEQGIPPILARLVGKLLAKNPEDRYQSAHGLRLDLLRCLEALERGESLQHVSFPLGRSDMLERFLLPQRLYGRQCESARLERAFAEATHEPGPDEPPPHPLLLLISGYSGVGKTTLIQEVYKPLTAKRGIFVAGKFEQFRRHTPYSALRQALGAWCRHVLADSEQALAAWRQRILEAAGHSGQLLIELVPELALVLGPQPPLPELGPREAENRFHLVVQGFIRTIGGRESPLVIFLDDLQWADVSSLRLLASLLLTAELPQVLFIGAYRDNEVDASHPLLTLLTELKEGGARVDSIHLEDLGPEAVRELLADAFHSTPERVAPAAGILYQKTHGNAFHTLELLKLMHHEQVITYVYERGEWQVDPRRLRALPLSDNVVELLTRKLTELPAGTRASLEMAACLGNRFELRLLSLCCEKRGQEMFETLRPAVLQGLVVPLDGHSTRFAMFDADASTPAECWFRFQHDRVQQACDSLLQQDDRARLHLKIGRLLHTKLPPEQHEAQLTTLTDHFNFGRRLLRDDPRALAELSHLNLQAARQAKSSMAYAQALGYASAGIELLPEDAWRTDYTHTFALYRMRHECQYLSGDYAGADETAGLLLAHARSPMDAADVYGTAAIQASIRGRYDEAISLGRKASKLLGFELPADEQLDACVEQEFACLMARLDTHTVKALMESPPLQDREMTSLTRLLASIVGASYFWNLKLWAFLTLRSVRIGLERGYFNELPFSLGNTGTLCVTRGQYARAWLLARAGVELGESRRSTVRCRAFNCLALCVSPWAAPLREAVEPARRGHLHGIEDGDLEYSCYCLFGLLNALLSQGTPLPGLRAEADRAIAFAARQKNVMAVPCFSVLRQFALDLEGRTLAPATFDDGSFQEARFLREAAGLDMAHCYFHVYKLQSFYLWGRYEEALRMSEEACRTLDQVAPFVQAAEHNFYTSLTLTALWPRASPAARERARLRLRSNQEQMRRWADSCPENFLHKLQLVEAELTRLEGRDLEALRLYQRSIQSARRQGFIQDEACAHELAASCCFELELAEHGEMHIAKAHHLYRLWGAERKAQELERHYPHVLLTRAPPSPPSPPPPGTLGTGATSLTVFDAMSILRATQAIGGELVLERLLETMLRVVFENAGAQRGALLLVKEGQPVVATEGSAAQVQVHGGGGVPLSGWTGGSHAVVHYVHRTRERLVLGDAPGDPRFSGEPYLRQARPRSVLCMPITHQGRLVALLYLENPLATHAFTQERTELLELLARQMAVSLENALLHAREREQRAQAERAVRLRDEFLIVASHELNTPVTSLNLNIQNLKRMASRAALPERIQGLLAKAEQQQRRISTLVSELLDVSELEAGSLPLHLEQVDLAALTRELLERLAPDFQRAQCTLLLDAPREVVGWWDRRYLERALHGLLANALKFGRGEPIEVNLCKRQAHVSLSVKDHGIGIAAEDQGYIFEKFGRAVSASHYGGLGLGLYLCRLFIDAHGGRLRVDSQPLQGATFTVELPLDSRAPGASAIPGAEEARVSGA
ncbi:MAG TPA: AAA family ATPase [Archangium sp.]|uniref:GAF domain-containing sensor histidine kinase n=1 Tax=Archangium sp. TaxID=1872627 RepID=UPI002E37FC45|nr:AAA family ATPase [Archangium sp.]HEX5749565.1 AAA family ATPase [Archangium sp.]